MWIIGVPELINRLESLLKDLMSQLGASEGTVFDAIGLSISGGSQPKMAENIKTQLKVLSDRPFGQARNPWTYQSQVTEITRISKSGGPYIIHGPPLFDILVISVT